MLTLKAFANFSPGCAFETLGPDVPIKKGRTLSGLRPSFFYIRDPGWPKRNPGLKLANAFSVSDKNH